MLVFQGSKVGIKNWLVSRDPLGNPKVRYSPQPLHQEEKQGVGQPQDKKTTYSHEQEGDVRELAIVQSAIDRPDVK